MAFEKIAELKIREAMREGKFDGLSRPEPIDLEEYFKVPDDLRMAYSVLRSAGCVPEEVDLLKEVERLERDLAASSDDATRARLAKSLADARLRLDLALERTRSQRRSGFRADP
jgi:DnaJ homologue, subfamily C, member 28, conserved domain